MQIVELNYKDLQDGDIESCAIIFISNLCKFPNIEDFGNDCTNLRDEENQLLVEPWENDEYQAREISANEFWTSCNIISYLEKHTDICPTLIKKVICSWKEWNNSFYLVQLDNGKLYGIAWWTTA